MGWRVCHSLLSCLTSCKWGIRGCMQTHSLSSSHSPGAPNKECSVLNEGLNKVDVQAVGGEEEQILEIPQNMHIHQ